MYKYHLLFTLKSHFLYPHTRLRSLYYVVLLGRDHGVDMYALGDCYCFVARTLLMHGSSAMPTLHSNRIAFASIVLGGMFLYWYWEAMLISYLAVRTPVLPIKTLEDLAQRPDYQVI